MKSIEDIEKKAVRREAKRLKKSLDELNKSIDKCSNKPTDFIKNRQIFQEKTSNKENKPACIGSYYITILWDKLRLERTNSLDGIARLIRKYGVTYIEYPLIKYIPEFPSYFSDFNKIKCVLRFLREQRILYRNTSISIRNNNKTGILEFDDNAIKNYYSLGGKLIKIEVENALNGSLELYKIGLNSSRDIKITKSLKKIIGKYKNKVTDEI
jgi:hypothetical protein